MINGSAAQADSAAAQPVVLSSTAAVESTANNASASHPAGVASPATSRKTTAFTGTDADIAVLERELRIPVSGVIAGELRDTFTEARGESRLHDAIDIPAPRGTPVLSAAPGRVLKLFKSKAGGLMVYAADSSERFILMYAHLDGYAPGLADGSPLSRGETIGVVGTTGNAPPNLAHLHFAIARSENISQWWKGTALNPYPLLKRK